MPEVDGKVVFSSDIDLPSMTAEDIYDKTYAVLDTLAHSENQIQSSIAIVNRKQHIIAARYSEWLEFFKLVYLGRPHKNSITPSSPSAPTASCT